MGRERKVELALYPGVENCIETAAKEEYRKRMEMCLRGEAGEELEEEIELLRTFLEKADFRKLRSECEPLILRGCKVRFVLTKREEGFDYRIEVE